MTEYFRIEGLNDINFDQAATGPYRLTRNEPPRNTSSPLTRDQVLMELTRLPKGVRGQALNRGMSKVSFPFNIQADTDALMEAYLHDFTKTLQDGQLYIETEGVRGTQAVLRSKTDGAASDSYKTIYYGYIEEQAARNLLGDSIKEHYLKDMQVTLYMEPKWRPASAITLGPNEIYCPSFEEDGDGNGTADDWGPLGASVLALESTIVLHGCYSQKVTTDAAWEGITNIIIVAPAAPANDAIAYVWVCRPAAGTDIRADLQDTTAGVSRATADYSTATTIVTVGGYEWRRLELIATNTIVPANNHQLWIYALSDTVTDWYVDKAFWKWDTTTIPDEWCDHWLIYNHYDTTEGAAHEGHINYYDVDDLKGDVDARLLMRVELEQNADETLHSELIVGRRTKDPPCGLLWWLEAEDRSAAVNWGTVALARCSAGNHVHNNTTPTGSLYWTIGVAPLTPTTNYLGDFDVFAVVYTDDEENTQFRLNYRAYDAVAYLTPNPWVKAPKPNDWVLIKLGSINAAPFIRQGYNPAFLYIQVEYQKDAADIARMDVLWLVPKDEPQMRLDVHPALNLLSQGMFWAIGRDEDFDYSGKEDPINAPTGWKGELTKAGGPMTLAPSLENRLYFVCVSYDVAATAGKEYECHGAVNDLQMIVSIKYLPQYISPLE